MAQSLDCELVGRLNAAIVGAAEHPAGAGGRSTKRQLEQVASVLNKQAHAGTNL